MKKQLIISFTFLFLSLFTNAQIDKKTREKIRSLKIAFITDQINLTAKEAEQFWPIYNDFEENKHILRNKHRFKLKKLIEENGEIEAITEEEAKELVTLKLNSDKQLLEAEKEFTKKITKVISYKKMIKLQISEIEFGRNLMRKYRKMRPNSKDR